MNAIQVANAARAFNKLNLELAPGSTRMSTYFIRQLCEDTFEVQDFGKTKESFEGYPTFKVSVKPWKQPWYTFRLKSRNDADRFVDWLCSITR